MGVMLNTMFVLIKHFQTAALVNIFYFFVMPLFSFVRLFDPLGKRLTSKGTFFKRRKAQGSNIEDYKHPF
ncbi:MAG: hypothetical protein KBA46_06395 [Candidatus Omnitrophica bacterium]|nr:hypothetical protein [Candidatus Omnitrophota bacterium]